MMSGIWQAALASSTAVRIPLFSGERVSSRFLILPLIFVMIAGVAALQRWIKNRPYPAGNVLLTTLLIPTAFFLAKHLNAWKVTEAAAVYPKMEVDLALKTVANHPDSPYTTGLMIGAAISALSGILILIRAKKSR